MLPALPGQNSTQSDMKNDPMEPAASIALQRRWCRGPAQDPNALRRGLSLVNTSHKAKVLVGRNDSFV
jgi:hypothetical protein